MIDNLVADHVFRVPVTRLVCYATPLAHYVKRTGQYRERSLLVFEQAKLSLCGASCRFMRDVTRCLSHDQGSLVIVIRCTCRRGDVA